ncbi:hypothetical protein DdX_15735 [Ditylenchus destructor]|uniref:F-box domain-containing protein n=1 Tax=Ditylenchus destructor TaxID=166010 RepID=A0AAD4QUH7_9BILA|nr:hypothetical protein DdX_15735 [Ditylenchus destructor]
MDNGTLVEVFKFLNYCQLAKNSLVSKRFSNLIRTHRHSLELLYVDSISMKCHDRATAFIKVFTKQLSPKAYNQWVIRNQYSKQIPLEDQVGRMQRRQYEHNVYRIFAQAVYKDPNHHPLWNDMTTVFYASTKLDHDNWPLFQHFVRLLSDPFIYIRCLELTSQNDVFNLLARAISSDRNRFQSEKLLFYLYGNAQKSICWIKDHLVCKKFEICNRSNSNYDQEWLDFFVTGSKCTSEISTTYYVLSRVVVDFVQKFLDLKDCDEYQFVESIECNAEDGDVEALTERYAKFVVNEDDGCTIFEFVNNDVGKKLRLNVTNLSISKFTTMDNGTIVEVFKYLDYCGLAKSSLVSKWFRDLIRSHRHKLALMCVESISITQTNVVIPRSAITIFGQKLSPGEYNEWIIRNNYSEEVQIEGPVAGKQITHNNNGNAFQLCASAAYENLNYPWDDPIYVFFARAILNQDNWHLFQYFVLLLTDPFIYIRALELILPDDVLNLLAAVMNPVRYRLQCKRLRLYGDIKHKSISWIKGHVSCRELDICSNYSNYVQELVDFFVTGAQCATEIRIAYCVLSKVVVDLIQKFLDLKDCDEYRFVKLMVSNAEDGDVEVLTDRYAKFLVKKEVEEYDYEYRCTLHFFEFVNKDVGKKLKLTVTDWSYSRDSNNVYYYSLKIDDL